MKLNNITIISICHSDKLDSTIKAMEFCLKQAEFEKQIILTEKDHNHGRISIIGLDKKIDLVEYNRMCINDLVNYVDTDFCLVIQWDGFIIDINRWTDEFLNYDYIGSPWANSGKNCIGNGGFSLRSRKFLEVSSTVEYTPYECTWEHPSQKLALPISPEDWFLCYHNYDYLIDNSIKFPTRKIAEKFSSEHPSATKPFNRIDINTYKSFGFHGDFNYAAMELLNETR